jgi:carbamoyl-phosphate synthase small subunit
LFRAPSNGLANGISTYKMFNGHRGINHPVKNLISGKGEITSQNHGFAVNKEEAILIWKLRMFI